MLRFLVVLAQLVSVQTAVTDTGAYSSEALRQMVGTASDSNRLPPASLREYRSRIYVVRWSEMGATDLRRGCFAPDVALL